MNFDIAIVIDEAELAKPVHEKAYASLVGGFSRLA
jgi:hypothetical protein